MKYWAVARCLGLTDEEFWKSTLAKITAMYKVKVLTWDRNRDYFVCQLAAFTLNGHRTKQTDKVWTADELILQRYPASSQTVTITHAGPDLDRGVPGDWRAFKSSLKGLTGDRERKNQHRRIHHGS